MEQAETKISKWFPPSLTASFLINESLIQSLKFPFIEIYLLRKIIINEQKCKNKDTK